MLASRGIIMTGALLLFGLGAGADNLIKNGGFEDWPGVLPARWCDSGKGGGERRKDTVVKASGDNAVCFEDGSTPLTLSQTVPVQAGEVYRISCKARLIIGGGCHFKITCDWKRSDGKSLGAAAKYISDGDGRWTEEVMANLVAPTGAVSANVFVGPYGEKVDGRFWVDDVVMEPERTGAAADFRTALAAVPLLDGAEVRVDGKLDEGVWARAVSLTGGAKPAEALLFGTPEGLCFAATMRRGEDKPSASERLTLALCPDSATYEFTFGPEGAINPREGVECAVAGEPGSWTVEGRIPLAALGLKPGGSWLERIFTPGDRIVEGTRWKANLTFADGSAWSPSTLGELVFMEGVPAVRGVLLATTERRVVGTTATLAVGFNLEGKREVTVEASALRGDKAVTLGRVQKALEGDRGSVTVPLECRPEQCWVSVSSEGALLYRAPVLAPKKYFSLGYDISRYRHGYSSELANDTHSFQLFYLSHPFKRGGLDYVPRAAEPVDLLFETPPGVEPLCVLLNAWGDFRGLVTPFKKTGTNGGYSQYVCALPRTPNSNLQVFLKTSLVTGAKGKYFFQSRWNDGQSPKLEMAFTVVEIGRIKPFERMPSYWHSFDPEFAAALLERPEELFRLGLNTLPVPLDEALNQAGRKALYDQLAPLYQRPGAYTLVQGGGANPRPNQWRQDPDAHYLGLDGKPVNCQFGYPTICHLYRGKYWREWLDKIAASSAVKEYGATWLYVDMEFWPDPYLDSCYCPRCLKAWGVFRQERYPGKQFPDPKDFMRPERRAAEPEACAAWNAFAQWRWSKWWADIKAELGAAHRPGQRWSGPRPGFLVSEWRPPQASLLGKIDYFETAAYEAPINYAKLLEESVATATRGGDPHCIMACMTSVPGFYGMDHLRPETQVYTIMECASWGVQGFGWWYQSVFDTTLLKTMVEGYRIIRPFEDIYLDGKVEPKLACEVSANAVVLRDEALVGVRDYLVDKTRRVTLRAPCSGEAEVFDARSQEKLGVVSPASPSLTVELSPAVPMRLLHVGPEGSFKRRVKACAMEGSKCE